MSNLKPFQLLIILTFLPNTNVERVNPFHKGTQLPKLTTEMEQIKLEWNSVYLIFPRQKSSNVQLAFPQP